MCPFTEKKNGHSESLNLPAASKPVVSRGLRRPRDVSAVRSEGLCSKKVGISLDLP